MKAQATITLPPEITELIQSSVKQTVSEMLGGQHGQMQKVPEWLNLGQSAKLLSISRGTLNKMIKRGDIHVVYLNSGTKRISKKSLLEYMAQKSI